MKKKVAIREETSDENTRDESSKQDMFLIGMVLAVIAVFGLIMFYVAISSKPSTVPETMVFNGFVFEKHGEIWTTLLKVGDRTTGKTIDYEVYFHFTPKEVESIPTMKNSKNTTITPDLFMNSKKIYITTDPEYPASVILGGVEIAKILGQIYQKEVKASITRPGKTSAEVITCKNISASTRVIDLRLGNKTGIFSDNGCIIVQGTDSIEVLKASERLAFEMLKIL